MKCKRKLFNILIKGKEKKLIQIYLNILEENILWFNSNKSNSILSFHLIFHF